MIDLVFGLHLYQPPNQRPDMLEKITKESYLPAMDFVLEHPRVCFAADIARSASEALEQSATGRRFILSLREAVKEKKISLVNTAAYHPILPLIPEKEIKRQLILNEISYKELLKDDYIKCEGVFPPEMAFSENIIPAFRQLDYRWAVTDDVPFTTIHHCPSPFDWIPQVNGLAVFLRSNLWSKKIAFDPTDGKTFAAHLKTEVKNWFGKRRGYLVVWLDWETFGHHRPEFIDSFLKPFFENLGPGINAISPEELLSRYPKREIFVPPGTWSTTAEDFRHKNYWPLWKNPHVEFHQIWWQIAKIVLRLKTAIDSPIALALFDRALYSCQTWQYSMGNKELAARGIKYFKEIASLEEAAPCKERMDFLAEKLESMCR